MFTLHNGDCLEYMKTLEPNSVQAVITDPPYGIDKEEWDGEFPVWLLDESFRISELVIIIPGIWSLGTCISAMKDKYLWTVAGHKPGAMSNTPIGFNNWQPIVIGGSPKIRAGVDAFDFRPTDPDESYYHSCQKPLNFMRWIISRFTLETDIIFDPFMGSGSTGIAALQLGRSFMGCELSPEYFAVAEKRIKKASLQQHLFTPSNNRGQRTGGESAANLSLFPAEGNPPAKVTAKSTRR